MRLRSGRGVYRHNLQPILDLEDFITNRTSGQPSSIFYHLGNAAKLYCSTDDNISRTSKIPFTLAADHVDKIPGLNLTKVKELCSDSVYKKSKRFEVIKSSIISTQVYTAQNTIEGEFRAAQIHDQVISWNVSVPNSPFQTSNRSEISLSCTCRHHIKVTEDMDINN